MEEYYAECRNPHQSLDWNFDGCQAFKPDYNYDYKCNYCNCHRNVHRKVQPKKKVVEYKKEVVYTTCHKIHVDLHSSVDGCQEFHPAADDELTCAACGCHMSFHRNEITTATHTTSIN